jgi:hypothetical protein
MYAVNLGDNIEQELWKGEQSVLKKYGWKDTRGLTVDQIIREFMRVLAVKRAYGPRLWDMPGVAGLQVGLSKGGRPILNVIVETPGDAAKIPKALVSPGPLGRTVKVQALPIGYRLKQPKRELRDAYTKLDQFMYHLQGFRTAGIATENGKTYLTAVLFSKQEDQYVPSNIDGFPVKVYYMPM